MVWSLVTRRYRRHGREQLIARCAGAVLGAARVLTEVLIAYDEALATASVLAAVDKPARWGAAHVTSPDHVCSSGKLDGLSPVEDGERSLPQPVIAECLTIANYAAVDLVDLAEPAALHRGRKNLAPNAASAISDNGPVFDVVVHTRINLLNEAVRRAHIRHDRVFKPADLGLPRVAAVKKYHLVCALFDQLVDRAGAQMLAAADDSTFVDLRLFGNAECDELIAHLDAEPRKVDDLPPARGAILALQQLRFGLDEARAIAPLHLEAGERRVLARALQIALAGVNLAADGAIDAVLRHDNSAAQPERFAQFALPETHRVGVGDRSESVIEKNLGL